MKTKEFIVKVENMGYVVGAVGNDMKKIFISGTDEIAIVAINTEDTFVFSTDFVGIQRLDDEKREDLLNVVLEYVKTPVEERGEPKKYRLKLPLTFRNTKDVYLHYGKMEDEYYFDDLMFPHPTKQILFTQEEIDEMPKSIQDFVQSLIKEDK